MLNYVIFHIEGGIGKNIAATSVAESIKKTYPDHNLIIVTAWPEVFLHNPNVFRVYKFGHIPYFYKNYIENRNSIILRMEPYHAEDLLYQRKSLIEIWCDVLKIPFANTPPKIFLTQRELLFVSHKLKKDGPVLLVHSSGGAENQPYAYSWARDLPHSFAQDLIDSLKSNFSKILHVRRNDQLELQNTISVSDNIRNLFCYIALSDKIIAIDSFVQHAAAALNKKAVVGWISNSPTVFGYSLHDNIAASGNKSFRHDIDSYLESDDWTGSRMYECPYDDISNIFNKNDFIKSILN